MEPLKAAKAWFALGCVCVTLLWGALALNAWVVYSRQQWVRTCQDQYGKYFELDPAGNCRENADPRKGKLDWGDDKPHLF